MVATFSPHRDAGGTLQLHSPTSIHHIDALAELRRSLSRSPSKPDLRSYTARSQSPSSRNLPFSPSPLSPRRSTSDNLLHASATATLSPLAIPFPPSARIHRPSARRAVPPQGTPRMRTSPKSPSKRVLVDSTSKGNLTPIPFRSQKSFEKDQPGPDPQTTDDKENEGGLDVEKAPRPVLKRHSGNFSTIIATSSPMKRSDGIMDMDQATLDNPSAKRRSLHGAPFGPDFNIFDLEGRFESDTQPESQGSSDDIDLGSFPGSHLSQQFSSIPKRSSSLRKSTLQQRQHERPALFKTRPGGGETPSHSPLIFTAAALNPKTKQRMSLDSHIAPAPKESPFSAGFLPNASIHVVSSQSGSQTLRHPLSRTITQSSSSSSIMEDSPTHEPIHKLERPRPTIDFSKSLPIGASRPTEGGSGTQGSSSQGSFATPASYKFAKPLPAAFMSTGLISKKNRNVEEPQGGLPKAHMPDTPCKRFSGHLGDALEGKPDVDPRLKEVRQPFGTPSTPNLFGTQTGQFAYPPGTGIFSNATRRSLARRASFVSSEGEDKGSSQSPNARPGSQSTDSDFPPTPTKQTFGQTPDSVQKIGPTQIARGTVTRNANAGIPFSSSKSDFVHSSPDSVEGGPDSVIDESPSASLRLKSGFCTTPGHGSFTRSRLLKNLNSPTPLSGKYLAVPCTSIASSDGHTKNVCVSSASPIQARFALHTPRTPQEALIPPDPSGLSISAHNEHPSMLNSNNSASGLPATPTAAREYFPTFGARTSLPLTGVDAVDVDASLNSRFEKVELIGTGEFSQVYRVTQQAENSSFHSVFSLSTSRSGSQASLPERVWAVKKSKHPYAGTKDRQKKIHEVDVLKILGQNDHIVSFVDSWEDRNHLYIQTEFCEEGSLDLFLAQVGLKARLDDFRIWKILLELSLGLKHIHDHGYIHLDLKPANILITFEGVLKIADFGMATKWPANAGIEGEGDREYIGPEILKGQYDMPADIFALGLIMLETAGNVELPDNGVSWQKLRNGDMSDVPSLTWSSEASNICRDVSGNPLSREPSTEDMDIVDFADDPTLTRSPSSKRDRLTRGRKSIHMARSGELTEPPTFMTDPTNEHALDRVVRWMISPNPADRPKVDDILLTTGVQWADARRRAGATVFEGNWGPADEVLAEDAEMIDV